MILDLVPENDPILSESIPSYNHWVQWDKPQALDEMG